MPLFKITCAHAGTVSLLSVVCLDGQVINLQIRFPITQQLSINIFRCQCRNYCQKRPHMFQTVTDKTQLRCVNLEGESNYADKIIVSVKNTKVVPIFGTPLIAVGLNIRA